MSQLKELTFFEIQQAFNDYWEPFHLEKRYYTENGIQKKAAYWKQIRYCEWCWDKRVVPTTCEFPEITTDDILKQIKQSTNSSKVSGNWHCFPQPTTLITLQKLIPTSRFFNDLLSEVYLVL